MSELSNKISYIKGLAEGMKLAEKSDEGGVIEKMIDALSDMAAEIEDLSLFCDDVDEELDVLNESVADIGMSIGDIYEQLDGAVVEPSADDDYLDEDDEEFDEDGLFEIMCPECGEEIIVDFDMLDDEHNIVCPNCHKEIDLDFEIEDDDDDV
ncbi:MAG: hypothetical protein IJH94_05920 [Clostridia bacterium]|nr:hypothetical protein [Clostridia bacterium]